MTAAHYAGLSRIPLTLAAAFLILHVPGGRAPAAAVVLIAGITDILDGALARRHGTVSGFGAVLDFTADKIFVLPTLFLAVRHDAFGLWLAVVIAMRDLIVMGVRAYTASTGFVVAVDRLGKVKSFVLYVALGALLLELTGASLLLLVATLLAVLSGAAYVRRASPLLAPALLRARDGGLR